MSWLFIFILMGLVISNLLTVIALVRYTDTRIEESSKVTLDKFMSSQGKSALPKEKNKK